MATTSSITDKKYGSTQTDPIDLSMAHHSVTIPPKVYYAMVTIFHGKDDERQCFQNGSNHHAFEQKSVFCQTDFESSSQADQNKRSATTDGKTGHNDLEASDHSGGDGFVRKVASSVATASNSGSASKQSDASLKKTSSGKHYDSNFRIMIPRLTDEMIRTLVSPLDRLPKISCKKDIDEKLAASGKRSASPDHEQQRTKQVKVCQSREMFHTLARSIESLADSNTDVDSMIGDDDLESWCVDEALRVLEKCKHRPSGGSSRSQQK